MVEQEVVEVVGRVAVQEVVEVVGRVAVQEVAGRDRAGCKFHPSSRKCS